MTASASRRRTIAHVALVVRDYDEAIVWYTTRLGFTLVDDTSLGGWPEQETRVGNQTGGRMFLFLHTDDFARGYHAMRLRGVTFVEDPRHQPYGTVAVFVDLYGNKWDLLQRK